MIEQFVELVRKYLTLVDGLPSSTPREFLFQCAILLPRIYSLGQQLPDVELPESDRLGDESKKIEPPMGRVYQFLGEYNLYSEVFDPITDTEAIKTTLADDLSDIYADLKRPLMKYESTVEADRLIAVWEWKFNIQTHAGDHLVDALRPIHRLVYDHLDPDLCEEDIAE